MKIRVLTLFPSMPDSFLDESMIGRAIDNSVIDYKSVNIRDYADNKYGKVDDTLYGGGTGMLMMCEPIYRAWVAALESCGINLSENDISPVHEKQQNNGSQKESKNNNSKNNKKNYKTLYMSPKGTVFNQKKALELSREENLIILCGHYEGVDERVIEEIVDEEISLGDFVLTGGEIAAAAIIDATVRLVEGVLPNEDAYKEESHMNYALECPQYTKPACWKGKDVPDVLLSGHHKKIEEWRRIAGIVETMRKRPDLYKKMEISEDEQIKVLEYLQENP